MRHLATGVLLVLASTVGWAQSEDYQALFERAVEAIDWDFANEWAYTETTLTEDDLWVARFDPRQEEQQRWTLISVDGREPSDEQREKLAHDKEEHADSNGSQRMSVVGDGTLRLLEENDDFWLFGFTPEEDDIECTNYVDATLKIIKDGHYLESIALRNSEVIRPGFGTRITTFKMLLSFAAAADGGPIVPRSVKVQLRGRALLFIGIDETEIVEYSDFEYAPKED